MDLKKLLNIKTKKKKLHILSVSLLTGILTLSICGCQQADSASSGLHETRQIASEEAAQAATTLVKGSRDNTSLCLVPKAPGVTVYENEYAHLDASNVQDGYVVIRYTGDSHKVKLQITGPESITYTYNLTVGTPTDEVFPLQCGSGEYLINVFENIEGIQYTTVFSQLVDVNISDEFSPFLYPNQYVNFNSTNNVIKKGEELAYSCNNELEVVSAVYNYVIQNIAYDYDEAETVQSGYIPDIDEVLETRKGICLDYSALMTSMLRSQKIPTRMEVGYAGTAYHAWLSTYITDVGWVNGMIEFDGTKWSLMDPTFASNTNEKALKDFIGDGENYSVKYIY